MLPIYMMPKTLTPRCEYSLDYVGTTVLTTGTGVGTP